VRSTRREAREALIKLGKRQMTILATALLIVVVAAVFLLTNSPKDYPNGTAGAPVVISVVSGETGSHIAANCQSKGVILKASTMINLLIHNTSGIGISPGLHRIDTHIPSELAISELLDRKRLVDTVEVLPGSTLSDVLGKLRALESIDQNSSIAGVVPAISNPMNSLEGELAPLQYSFQSGTTLAAALSQMANAFRSEIAPLHLSNGFGKYTAYQVLTIASLIQIEADPSDYQKAAAVIYNRLKLGMPLQLNSTVQYAISKRGQINLSTADTKVKSPYNTYLNLGLPPTPISNPSNAAITAADNPATGNWIYFITVKPHDTRFTNSYATFQGWVALYNQNVKLGLFK